MAMERLRKYIGLKYIKIVMETKLKPQHHNNKFSKLIKQIHLTDHFHLLQCLLPHSLLPSSASSGPPPTDSEDKIK